MTYVQTPIHAVLAHLLLSCTNLIVSQAAQLQLTITRMEHAQHVQVIVMPVLTPLRAALAHLLISLINLSFRVFKIAQAKLMGQPQLENAKVN